VPRLSLCTLAARSLLIFCSVSLTCYVFGLPFLPSFGGRRTVPLSCTDVAMPCPLRLPPISSLLSSSTNSSPPRHPMTRPSLPPVWNYPPLPPLPPLESLPHNSATATEAASLLPLVWPAPERGTPHTATFTLAPINIDSGLDFDGVGSSAVRTDIPVNDVPSGKASVFLSTPPPSTSRNDCPDACGDFNSPAAPGLHRTRATSKPSSSLDDNYASTTDDGGRAERLGALQRKRINRCRSLAATSDADGHRSNRRKRSKSRLTRGLSPGPDGKHPDGTWGSPLRMLIMNLWVAFVEKELRRPGTSMPLALVT